MRRALFFLTFFSLSLALALGETPRTRAILETSLGRIEVELFTDKAPLSAGHFIRMVREGYLNKGSFYRTVTMENQPRNKVKILVVQGGLMEDRLSTRPPGSPMRPRNKPDSPISGEPSPSPDPNREAPPLSFSSPLGMNRSSTLEENGIPMVKGSPSLAGSSRGWMWSKRSIG